MSAPELPPIATKKSGLLSNGYIRSYSFHKLQDAYYQKRNSIHSDSSLQRYRFYSNSQGSSASSQASRGRVLSAGTDRLTNRQVAELPKDSLVPCKSPTWCFLIINTSQTGIICPMHVFPFFFELASYPLLQMNR